MNVSPGGMAYNSYYNETDRVNILLGILLTAVASAMFKTFLFGMFEFATSNN